MTDETCAVDGCELSGWSMTKTLAEHGEAVRLLKRCIKDWDRKWDPELPSDIDKFMVKVSK